MKVDELCAADRRQDKICLSGWKHCVRTVLAAAENQRMAITMRDTSDPSDKDDVVAAVSGRFGAALEHRQRIGQDGATFKAWREGYILKFIRMRVGEMLRIASLIARQHIDDKCPRSEKTGQGRCLAPQAPQDKGWIERKRSEGIHRQAFEFPGLRPGCHDSHPGGVSGESAAKFCRFDVLMFGMGIHLRVLRRLPGVHFPLSPFYYIDTNTSNNDMLC
jgi:hypothetical protein